MSTHNFSFGKFTWFVGVVENRDDPLKVGRLQVRVFGYHADAASIPTSSLPQAQVMQPVTSAAQDGVGQTPTGVQVGTHVIGFFADGEKAQIPIVMGTLAGLSTSSSGEEINDVDNLGTGEDLQDTVIEKKNQNLLTSSATTNSSSGLSLASSLSNQISSKITGSINSLTSIGNTISDLSIPDLTSKLNTAFSSVKDLEDGIISTVDTITSAVEDVEQYISALESIKNQIDVYYEIILNIPENAEQFAKDTVRNTVSQVKGWSEGQLNQVLGSMSQIRKLRNLDFSTLRNAKGSLSQVKSSMAAVKNLQNTIANVSNITEVVSSIKNMTMSTPAFSAVRQISNAIASRNTQVEKKSPAAPKYPMNKVKKTEGGHIEEFDDTPGVERYHRYHPAGSFIEIQPDGTQVQKIVKDDYGITLGDKFIHIEGTVQVNIGGNVTLVIDGNLTTQVTGDKTDVVTGDYSLLVGGDTSIATSSSLKATAGTNMTLKGKRIDLN